MYGRLFRLQNSFNKHLRIGRGFISGHGQRLYSSASEATNDRKGSSASVGASLPSEADVVVVGGGVIGCATLYHLTKLGITNAILLERDKLTSGTTWHTAGLVWNLRPSDVEIQVLESSRRLMEGLEEETGVHPGWINNGGMFVASNKQRLDEYKRLHTIGKAFGIESQVLSPKETKKVYPLLNVDDVYGTLYVPSNGTIDPAGYCMALTKGATNRGAKVFEGTPVTGVDVITDDYGTKRVNALNTERGTIKTKAVVNCAGAWGPYLGAMAGVNVPLVAMKHAYIVTERIEGIQNMPNIRDHDASIYLKLQGDALCVGGYEPNPHFWDEVKKDFSFGLFDLDWDVFSFNFNGSLNRLPVLEKIGVKSTVCGPESFTPDHKPLLGESPEVRGFYLGCGFNSAGMMLSGGCAEELANWVKNGHPEKDMYAYDISRFYNKLTGDQRWLRERSHEAYAKNYSIVFPYDEPLASRKMRKAPLFETLAKKGCHYQERLGWERPGWFSSELCVPKTYDYYGYYGNKLNYDDMYKSRLEEEYTFDFPDHHAKIGIECLSCREMAAIFDMSYFGQFYLTGPDAKKAADWIFTNDMNKPPGTVLYTCMLNDNGGTAGDLTVAVLESGDGSIHAPKFEGVGYYIATGGGTAQYAHKHILDILQDQKLDCQLIDRSNDMSLLSVQGPNSRNILKHLTSGEFSDEAFPFSTSQVMKIASHDCRVFRLTFVGELGYELHISNDSVIPVYEAITNVGKQYGLVDAGYRAIDSLSIEKGYRHWHGDLRSDDTPLESLLGFTCKLNTDTPFKGREALEKQKTDGIKKRLVCFTLDDRVPLVGLETIYRNNKPCGFIRRADYAFALDTVIGYGYISDYDNPEVTINQKYIKEGDYEIEHLGKRYHATYHLKSPFDPKNLRIKGNYEMPLPINIETFDIDQKSLHT